MPVHPMCRSSSDWALEVPVCRCLFGYLFGMHNAELDKKKNIPVTPMRATNESRTIFIFFSVVQNPSTWWKDTSKQRETITATAVRIMVTRKYVLSLRRQAAHLDPDGLVGRIIAGNGSDSNLGVLPRDRPAPAKNEKKQTNEWMNEWTNQTFWMD